LGVSIRKINSFLVATVCRCCQGNDRAKKDLSANSNGFPTDFMFQLSREEANHLREYSALVAVACVKPNDLNGAQRLNGWNDWNRPQPFIERLNLESLNRSAERGAGIPAHLLVSCVSRSKSRKIAATYPLKRAAP
jgi:hypothetical protein